MPKQYVKAFNTDMTGYGGYAFEVGKTYETETDDTWRWFHYADRLSTALSFYNTPNVRFCVVEPLGDHLNFRCALNGRYHTTNKIRIVREIEREEMFRMLLDEDCPFWLIKRLNPPYEVFLRYNKHIRGDNCYEVLKRQDLTADQKKSLLPKSRHKYIDVINEPTP